nr:BlaI/MecI/CopY family transcriptional regulator [Microlunatus panaciterrae]
MGDLERAVMERLWSRPEPQSVREVQAGLTTERDLAYTTVMTVLDRLAKKKLATRRRDGRAYRYSAARSREQLVAEVMHTALDGSRADRTAALVEFVGRVSPDEAAALRAALSRLDATSADEVHLAG